MSALSSRYDGGNLGGCMEASAAHADQQIGERWITSHFAADAHVPAGAAGEVDGLEQQLEDGRMPGSYRWGNGLIGAVDRERVLDEVVGADGQEKVH